MKKFKYLRVCTLVVCMLVIGSCDDELLNTDPTNKTTQTYFNTPDQIEQGAFAVYSSFFHNRVFAWELPEVFDGLANEFEGRPASANEPEIQALLRYQHNNSNGPVRSFWRLLYRMILRSNLVIDKGEKYTHENGADEIVSRSLGDAYFLRGWAYSQLAFHWGSVPIRTIFIVGGNGNAPRAPLEEVWGQAEADFKRAQDLLPEKWEAEFLGRATKGAATGFLGKLYLYNKEYVKAETEFEKMQGKYTLLVAAEWDNNFGETNENNNESVFEIQCAHYPGTDQFYIFGDPENNENPGRQNAHAQLYSWTDWANWAFQPRRVADFEYKNENGEAYVDPRAALTFYGGTIGDQTYCDNCPEGVMPFDFAANGYWYRKGTNRENKLLENNIQTGNNIRLMRYADVLLMRAECHLKQGDVNSGIDFINQVRNRIGAFTYTGTYTHDQAFELLKRERQIEFMGEQIRYNDLKRWGILEETMNIELQALFGLSTVKAKHYLFPIPQVELDTNTEFGTVADSWN